jgi:serine protease Do
MNVFKWGSLAGGLALAVVTAGPATAVAQDREPVVRAFDALSRGAQIGLTVTDVDSSDAKQPKAGVMVETVTPGGPADKAGVKAGDTITEFDGERVRSVTQFSRLVRETAAGNAVPASVLRGGQKVTVTMTPEHRSMSDDFAFRYMDIPRVAPTPRTPMPPAAPRAVRPFDDTPMTLLRGFGSGRRLGITIESIDDQLADYFGVKEGALVKSVLDGSAAQKAGLKAGDVITAINGTKVYDTSDVNRAMDRLETNGDFTVDVMREKKPQTLKGKLETREMARTRIRTIL